jgi:plasmid stabilization system protein ParE
VDYAIVWSEPATADLEAIIRFVARDSAAAAETLRVAILEHVELLARLPHIGPVYEKAAPGGRGKSSATSTASSIGWMTRPAAWMS